MIVKIHNCCDCVHYFCPWCGNTMSCCVCDARLRSVLPLHHHRTCSHLQDVQAAGTTRTRPVATFSVGHNKPRAGVAQPAALKSRGDARRRGCSPLPPGLRPKAAVLLSTGALFATIACASSLSHLVAYSLFNWLYAATLHLMKGFGFLFALALLLIPTAILG